MSSEIFELSKFSDLVVELITDLFKDTEEGELEFDTRSVQRLPLIFPETFHKLCRHLDLKTVHVLLYNPNHDEVNYDCLGQYNHVIYIRDKKVIKKLKASKKFDKEEFAISRYYQDIEKLYKVDLDNWTCHCDTFFQALKLASIENSAQVDHFTLKPSPICEHLLCVYIWKLNHVKLMSYINIIEIQTPDSWLYETEKLSNPTFYIS